MARGYVMGRLDSIFRPHFVLKSLVDFGVSFHWKYMNPSLAPKKMLGYLYGNSMVTMINIEMLIGI